jgi:hypothetical protein
MPEMKRRGLLSILLIAAVGTVGLKADDVAAPVTTSTGVSEEYPQVSCTSTDAGLNADVLQLADDTRDQLGTLLQLGSTWRFPVHIVIVLPDDPLAGKVKEERVAVTTGDKTMTIEAALPASDLDAKAFIQRQFVTALLWEKFFAADQSFDAHTKLDVVPLWLTEGLNEWLMQDAGRDREAIVRRAAQNQRAPALTEITSWDEISSDRLLGLYQRAFCYYLVNSLIHGGDKRANFQEWLTTLAGPHPSSASFLFPTEADWQRQLLEAPARSHDTFYTWEDSFAALTAAEIIAIPNKKEADTQICTLDNVVAFPRKKELTEALRKKVFDLTALEVRAHVSWRPVIALYRLGLTALVNNHAVQAQQLIQEAQQRRTGELAYHQKLVDYINWFEVTRDYTGNKSAFESYFSTARETEDIQSDPDHPNPLRARLNQVESRL